MALEDYFVDEEEVAAGSMYLLYGLPGSGKTYTGMTAADDEHKLIVIDTELRADFKRKTYFADSPIEVAEALTFGKLISSPLLEGIDDEKTIARIMNIIIEVAKKKDSNMVVMIDTISEVWKIVQSAGKKRLARAGKVDLDTLGLTTQFDWGTITAMHYKLMLMCRLLTKGGVDIILTSRANYVPDYVGTKADTYMMSQKDVPYLVDVMVQMRRKADREGNLTGKVTAIIEKAGEADSAGAKQIVEPSFEDIRKAVMMEVIK